MSTQLPDKPSALIRVALEDLDKAIAKGHTINMGWWVSPNGDGKTCEVCLAGAVMLDKFPALIEWATEEVCPTHIGEVQVERKLFALNEFRRGEIEDAFAYLGLELPPNLPARHRVPNYAFEPNAFRAAMHEMADMLEREGY
jgi:hypothetical protein